MHLTSKKWQRKQGNTTLQIIGKHEKQSEKLMEEDEQASHKIDKNGK